MSVKMIGQTPALRVHRSVFQNHIIRIQRSTSDKIQVMIDFWKFEGNFLDIDSANAAACEHIRKLHA